MMEDGLFDTFPCDAIYALHNWPGLKPGTIGINPGPMMAAADRFEILITGRGGHGAHPYQTIDPVTIAGQIITALQTIVSRNVNPLDSAVVSIGSLQAGHPGAMSVIPREARIDVYKRQVVACEKLRGAGKQALIGRCPYGETHSVRSISD